MRRGTWFYAAAATALSLGAPAAHSEESNEERVIYAAKPEHDIFKFDYGAPTSPAMTLLGLTPDKSPSSTSLTDFVISMPSTPGGNGGDSLALDFPAARLFVPVHAATLDTYQRPDARLFRLGYRTRLGLAMMTGNDGGSDPKKAVPSRLSLGLSTSLLDSSDPLVTHDRLLMRCVTPISPIAIAVLELNEDTPQTTLLVNMRRDANLLLSHSPIDRQKAADLLKVDLVKTTAMSEKTLRASLVALIEQIDRSIREADTEGLKLVAKKLEAAGVTKAVQDCAESANLLARYAADLDVGIGALAQGMPGQLEDLEWRGAVVWTSLKFPLGKPTYKAGSGEGSPHPKPESAWFLVASARVSWDERLQSGDSVTPEFRADTWDAWIGLERLTPSYRFTGQYGWLDTSARETMGKPFEASGERYLLSGQIRLGGDDSSLWLGISYGNGYGTSGDLEADTALVTLSYSPKPLDISGGR